MKYTPVVYSVVQCRVLYNTVQYCTVLYNVVQYSTVQYGTVQYNTIQRRRYERSCTITIRVSFVYCANPFIRSAVSHRGTIKSRPK